MFESREGGLTEVLAAVRALGSGLEVDVLSRDELVDAVDAWTVIRRVADGALTRLAAAYDRSGAWRDRGARAVSDDLAARTGAAPSVEARRLVASDAAASRPGLDAALRSGAVSGEQAAVIGVSSSTAEDDDALIAAARTESHRSFRDKAAQVRAAGDVDAEARRARVHRARRLTTWTAEDGTGHLHLQDLPERIAELTAALKPTVDRLFDEARRQGRREPVEAYQADALHAAVCGSGGAVSRGAVRPDRKVIAVVDAAALRRGRLGPGETCEIAGVGPVSVTAARAMLGDAILAVVVRDGVDIVNVTHLGRQVTAHQRTALEARGHRCEIIGCGATRHLEIDHIEPWALTRTTRLESLAWLCRTHHGHKTTTRARMTGPPGQRTFTHDTGPPPGDAPGRSPTQEDLFTGAR